MKRNVIAFIPLLASLAAAGCGTAPVEVKSSPQKPGFTNVVLSDDKTATASSTTFTKDTPKLFVTFGLKDVPEGDKITGTWVCEESQSAPPNYKIDSATVEVKAGMNVGDFSISRPTKGWPTGSYRIDMYWNDKLAESVKFKIG